MTPTTCIVTIEAKHSARVIQGLHTIEHLWSQQPGYGLYPYGTGKFIRATLKLEHGPYDAEGDAYVAKLLGCSPDDLIASYTDFPRWTNED
jgi:hypothetical protein